MTEFLVLDVAVLFFSQGGHQAVHGSRGLELDGGKAGG